MPWGCFPLQWLCRQSWLNSVPSTVSPWSIEKDKGMEEHLACAVCACDPAPAARSGRRAACQAASRGARTAEQLGGGFQWRRVGDRVAHAGGGKGPLIFLYLGAAQNWCWVCPKHWIDCDNGQAVFEGLTHQHAVKRVTVDSRQGRELTDTGFIQRETRKLMAYALRR